MLVYVWGPREPDYHAPLYAADRRLMRAGLLYADGVLPGWLVVLGLFGGSGSPIRVSQENLHKHPNARIVSDSEWEHQKAMVVPGNRLMNRADTLEVSPLAAELVEEAIGELLRLRDAGVLYLSEREWRQKHQAGPILNLFGEGGETPLVGPQPPGLEASLAAAMLGQLEASGCFRRRFTRRPRAPDGRTASVPSRYIGDGV
jgi:hypothetical protein